MNPLLISLFTIDKLNLDHQINEFIICTRLYRTIFCNTTIFYLIQLLV